MRFSLNRLLAAEDLSLLSWPVKGLHFAEGQE